MRVKSIYRSGTGLQLEKVGILERTKNPNIFMFDLGKLVNLTRNDFTKARGIGEARAEQLDNVRKELVELFIEKI